ncbi:sulfatase [Opitutales bacterium]|nr:sulfatase [Opitutales bacterium]
MIYTDDLGYGDLGCYGHPTIATPHLDRMAAEGQRWTDFYAPAPVCSASRAGLLTGRYPTKTGTASAVFFEWSAEGLDPAEVTIAETLKQAGYVTACVGKWHLGHQSQYLPTNQGFDSYYGIPYSNDMRLDPRMPFAEDVLLREGMTLERARARGNKINNWVPLMEGDQVIEYPCDQTTLTRRSTKRCIEFIQNNKERPFFLYYASSFPHIPLHASAEFRDKSRRGLYGDVVEELDASVGAILDTLRESGLAENTLVVFTSDNGPWLKMDERGGSAGLLRSGKGTTWEGGMREPTLFWWPGTIEAGSICRGIGSALDFYATFSALGQGTTKAEDSLNLMPALKGGNSPRSEFFFYREEELYAVRSGPWKLHLITEGAWGDGEPRIKYDNPLLFHLGHDPSEKYDIADKHTDVIEALMALVEQQEKAVKTGRNRHVKKLEYQERPDWAR